MGGDALIGVSELNGRIPAELTTFVGRHDELAQLSEKTAASRLVTVVGPGGVGKTRLAVHAATRLGAQIHGPVRFADLSVLREPDLVADVVAEALGVAPASGQSAVS